MFPANAEVWASSPLTHQNSQAEKHPGPEALTGPLPRADGGLVINGRKARPQQAPSLERKWWWVGSVVLIPEKLKCFPQDPGTRFGGLSIFAGICKQPREDFGLGFQGKLFPFGIKTSLGGSP